MSYFLCTDLLVFSTESQNLVSYTYFKKKLLFARFLKEVGTEGISGFKTLELGALQKLFFAMFFHKTKS